jgi:hypothetical protein
VFDIQGDGCLDVWNDNYNNRETLCGPGLVAWESVTNGMVNILAEPGEGMDIAAMINVPAGNRRFRKPLFRFFYEGKSWKEGSTAEVLVITAKFRPPIQTIAPPKDNLFNK